MQVPHDPPIKGESMTKIIEGHATGAAVSEEGYVLISMATPEGYVSIKFPSIELPIILAGLEGA